MTQNSDFFHFHPPVCENLSWMLHNIYILLTKLFSTILKIQIRCSNEDKLLNVVSEIMLAVNTIKGKGFKYKIESTSKGQLLANPIDLSCYQIKDIRLVEMGFATYCIPLSCVDLNTKLNAETVDK